MIALFITLFLAQDPGRAKLLEYFIYQRHEEKHDIFLQKDLSEINSCLLEVPSTSLYPTAILCPGDSNGVIVFDFNQITGGVPPYSYDWDDLGTPANDVFPDDGLPGIDSLVAGTYAIIVTDALGCVASASTEVEDIILGVVPYIDSVGACALTGGIQIVTTLGPPWFINYNWDFAFTPVDDDFGGGPWDLGFLPEENDSEDLYSGLEGGIYFLTLTFIDDTLSPLTTCIWRDTFNIFIDSTRIVCPFGDAFLFGGSFDTTITCQWQVDSLNGFQNVNPDNHHTGTGDPVLHITDMPTSWYGHQYRCRLIQSMDTTYSEPFTLKFGLCWNGTSSNWHSSLNWNCNGVPDSNTDVFVNSGMNPYPHVFMNAFCRTLHLQPGTSITVHPPSTLNITNGDP